MTLIFPIIVSIFFFNYINYYVRYLIIDIYFFLVDDFNKSSNQNNEVSKINSSYKGWFVYFNNIFFL
jgi:hypothetical protein